MDMRIASDIADGTVASTRRFAIGWSRKRDTSGTGRIESQAMERTEERAPVDA